MMTGLFLVFCRDVMKTLAQHKQPPVTETQIRCEATKMQPHRENPSSMIRQLYNPNSITSHQEKHLKLQPGHLKVSSIQGETRSPYGLIF